MWREVRCAATPSRRDDARASDGDSDGEDRAAPAGLTPGLGSRWPSVTMNDVMSSLVDFSQLFILRLVLIEGTSQMNFRMLFRLWLKIQKKTGPKDKVIINRDVQNAFSAHKSIVLRIQIQCLGIIMPTSTHIHNDSNAISE